MNDEGVNVARVRNEVDGTAASGWRGMWGGGLINSFKQWFNLHKT